MGIETHSPLIFAHRGASAYAPENTMAAFELAIQHKADLIELDAKLSADQHVVVIHDQTVDRTSDGTGRVADYPLAALQELNASNKFSEQYPFETIPTLNEVFEICRVRTHINIELANYYTPSDPLPKKVAQLIVKYELQTQVIVSSFHPLPLRRFHDLLPEVQIGFLAKPGILGFLSRGWLGRAIVPYQALHPEKSNVSSRLMDCARRLGFQIHTFTVNDPEDMINLVSLGVDGIITDDPQLAGQILTSYRSNKNHKYS